MEEHSLIYCVGRFCDMERERIIDVLAQLLSVGVTNSLKM
jgi:hypothetical protein